MQRVTGVLLILLLLAHFWVQHFFISDFYGKMNIVDLKPGIQSVSERISNINPLWGKHRDKFVAPVRYDLQEKQSEYYLSKNRVSGPTPVTILQQSNRTEIYRGRITDRSVLAELVGTLKPNAEIKHETISPKQIETKRMINHSDVQARVSNIWWKVYNLLFLVLAIYHGFIGIWDIVLDYEMGPLLRFTLFGVVVTTALVLMIVGLLIVIPM